jgi:peptide/nickel transport system permease protein
LGSAFSTGVIPDFTNPAFVWDVIKHQILPALALILGTMGGWVLSMRGMGITIQVEDFVLFAEHKGLNGYTIFKDYYLRNALLPQVTGLALALGTMVTSAIVIESMFGLPGLGTVLNQAIRSNDFTVIYGVVLFVTIAVATLMVLVELLYPLLDPRIRQE